MEFALNERSEAPTASGPAFARPVPDSGYAWWYVDALSDDRRHGLTIIAFVGSVFSPYYRFRRRKGPAPADDHVAINVALYGAAGHRWAMTERGRSALHRDMGAFSVGPSALVWNRDTLDIEIDEVTFPFPGRIKGRVRLVPEAINDTAYTLDHSDRHSWRPIAPLARVELRLSSPQLTWQGSGYFDSNWGDEPLEAGFRSWDWSRSTCPGGTTIHYDRIMRDGRPKGLSIRIAGDGSIVPLVPPPRVTMPGTLWRIPRATRSAGGRGAQVVATLEDTPFYARSHIRADLGHGPVDMMHESLDLDRFMSPVVQAMLPFRMPRRARWP
ncbi:MAG: carotenoid 1,2-hydratase [Hyphomicrobium sp.]|nr:carotenoid 1,2-hydratase [Hyphomicrobium sp.]